MAECNLPSTVTTSTESAGPNITFFKGRGSARGPTTPVASWNPK
jgi:hypothetical protein